MSAADVEVQDAYMEELARKLIDQHHQNGRRYTTIATNPAVEAALTLPYPYPRSIGHESGREFGRRVQSATTSLE